MHHWENIGFLSKGFRSTATSTDLTPMQFPFRDDDRWLALAFRDDTDPNEKDEKGEFKFKIDNDKLLNTVHFTVPFDIDENQCGIILDEWTEVIPADRETTGITFHYDQPNTEPPQTMLLVTPSKIRGKWLWDDVIMALEETLDMARKRAVEPSHIETSSYAQFLPTTMMAVSMHWITVATNLSVNNNIYKKINDN